MAGSAQAGSNGLQKDDIANYLGSLPVSQRGAVAQFFDGPYRDFTRHVLAHASGQGFLAGAGFGLAAVIAAVVLVNIKKDEVPADVQEAAVPV